MGGGDGAPTGGGLTGPGLLIVRSKITNPAELDVPGFVRWYHDEHIPEVIETSGVDSAIRGVTRGEQQESDQDRPFLAMYPLNDLSFLESKEFAGISVDSSLLPGTGHVFNFADFEYESYMRPVGIVTQEGNNKGLAKVLYLCEWEEDEDLSDKAYDQKHHETLTQMPGFLRALRFKHIGGGWSAGGGEKLPCPRWLQIIEIGAAGAGENLMSSQALRAKWEDNPQNIKLSRCVAYDVAGYFGNEEFFQGGQ